jgi:hypothetical protein
VVAGDGVHYGYGAYLGEIAGQPTVYHTGDNPGFRSISMWLPDRETAVVVLSNDLSTDVMSMANRLAELALE